jgi:hypothetical protein
MSEESTATNQEQEIDSSTFNTFSYSQEGQIRKFDDDRILAAITEKYPDFNMETKESTLRQVLIMFLDDSKYVNEVLEQFDMNIMELFQIIVRKYQHIFSPCYTAKLHKILAYKHYVNRKLKTYG